MAKSDNRKSLELDMRLAVERAKGHGDLSIEDLRIIADWISDTETNYAALRLFRDGTIRISVLNGEIVFHYDEPGT